MSKRKPSSRKASGLPEAAGRAGRVAPGAPRAERDAPRVPRAGRIGLGAALVLFLASQALFLIGGRTWLPITSNPSTYPRSPYGYTGALPDWTTTVDPAGSWNAGFVFDVLAREAMRHGTIAFWDPNQAMGHPMLENGLTGALYPPGLLRAVVPVSWWDLLWLLHWALAGAFFYLYLRRIELEPEAAFVGAAAVLAGGFFQTYLALRESVYVATWFPALLYCIERIVREPSWRWGSAALAFAVCCTITGGQPEVTFISLLVVLVYALLRLGQDRRHAFASFGRLAPGALAGLLLAAPHWVSFARYAASAFTHHSGSEQSGLRHLGAASLINYFIPHAFGRMQTYPLGGQRGWSWDLAPGWIPWGAVALAGLAFVLPANRRRFAPRFFAVGALLLMAKIWGLPLLNDLGRLPGLDRLLYPRYAGFALTFLLAGLAAFGLSAAAQIPRLARWAWASVAGGALLLVGFVIFAGWMFLDGDRAVNWDPALAIPVGALWIISVPLVLLRVRAAHPDSLQPMAFVAGAAIFLNGIAGASYGYSVVTEAALSVLCWISLLVLTEWMARVRSLPSTQEIVLWLSLAIAAPSLAVGLARGRFLPASWQTESGPPSRYDPLASAPYIEQLQVLQLDNRYRSYGIELYPMPNFNSAFGVSSLGCIEALQPAGTAAFLTAYLDVGADPITIAGTYWLNRRPGVDAIAEYFRNKRYYDLIGVKYLVSAPGLYRQKVFDRAAAQHPELRRVEFTSSDSLFAIWESRTAQPRAFFAAAVQVEPDARRALARVGSLADPGREVIVDRGAPSAGEHPDSASANAGPGAPAASVGAGALHGFAFERNEARIDYQTPGPGVLVLTDACQAGWKVDVDGARRELLRVDGAFLGVRIEGAGLHRVRFRYAPPDWGMSLIAALIGLVLVAFFTWRPPVRSTGPPQPPA